MAQSYRLKNINTGLVLYRVIMVIGMIFVESSVTLAEESERSRVFSLGEIVVTAGTISGDAGESSASLKVISKQEIEEKQVTSVTELLRQVEGLHVDQPGARGGVSSVYLRGADPNHTLVLIDGVRVNDPTNSRGGSFDFSTLSVDRIDRIEIVRGPLSSVYGSDAIAGVIHIITRRGTQETETRLDLSGGSFGYHRTLIETSGMDDRFDYSMSASWLDQGDPVPGSEFIGTVLGIKMGFLSAGGVKARFAMRFADNHQEAFPDDSGGSEHAVIRESENRDSEVFSVGLDLSQTRFSLWTPGLHIEYFHRGDNIDSPGVAPGIRDPFGIPPHVSNEDFIQFGFKQNNLFTVAEWLQFNLGLEYRVEDGQNSGALLVPGSTVPTGFNLDRSVWALRIEARYAFGDNLILEGGVSVDWPEDFETTSSPRVGASYRLPGSNTRLHGSWGRGFKLPSFFSLGHPIVGNPHLVSERSRSAELGIEQGFWDQSIMVHAIYFSNRVKEAIDFQETPVPILVNRQETQAQGMEAGFSITPRSGLSLSSHLTYVKTDIEGTDEELRNRPEWKGGVNLRWSPAPAYVIQTDVQYVGGVWDSSIPTGDRKLEDYTRVNLALTWRPFPAWEYYLGIENLFNANYEEAVGFPAPGFLIRVGLKTTF